MPNTSEYIVPQQGMITDLSSVNINSNQYTYALNAVTENKSGNENNLQNEMSNRCSIEFPPNYRIIGFVEVPEQKRTLYALVNPKNGESQIGEVTDCTFFDTTDKIGKTTCKDCPEYTSHENTPLEKQRQPCYCQYRILAEGCLNFNIDYPVDIEYKITSCSFNIYFTDFLNERRFMYFDYVDPQNLESHLQLQDKFKVTQAAPEGGVCSCEDGYDYDSETNKCTKYVQTPVEQSSDLRVACHADDNSYTNFGIAIYDTFNIDGTGSSTVYHQGDLYWSNPTSNITDGVLNRVALWACNDDGTEQGGSQMDPVNEYIGFIFPVDLTQTKTYYVGIAGDNKVRIRLDCVTIVDMNADLVGQQYSIGAEAAFKYWHVYPVTIPSGHHVIELTGYNFGNVAGFGAEIYDNTKAEIIGSNNGTNLNIIFTTANKIGSKLQVSDTFSGTCPNGSCKDINSAGEVVCTQIISVDPICDPCDTTIITDILDCNKLKIHPDFDRPCIAFSQFVNGGNLREGDYQVLIAYADITGTPISNYFPGTPIAPLFENQIEFETNLLTNKALYFKIDSLKSDSIYQYYNIVIAQTINQFTEFIYVGTFPTSQLSYTYTGFEKAIRKLAPTEVFFKKPYYQLARGVTTANNYLFFSGVKEYPTLNLQPVANNIKLQWETVALKEKAYYDPRNTYYFRTHQRDEVYAIGVVFEFGNGRDTCAFHIPGRIATNTDLQTVTGSDVITDLECDEQLRNLRWQVYNTGSITGGDHEYNEECEIDKCWEYGEFAYWESTELYPTNKDIWGDLCGMPIRHHKFPDSCVTHIHDGDNADRLYSQNNYIFPIGIRVDHQSVLNSIALAVTNGIITQEDADSIKSYRIVRGNRIGNKSIDAKGLIYNMLSYQKFDNTYYFPNYAYNDLRPDAFLNGTTFAPQRYTFHSPDIHFTNSTLGNILKIETNEYGKAEGYFTYSDCQSKYKFLSGFAYLLALGLGIAAALSATGEKTCRTITYHADDIQQKYEIKESGKAPFSKPYGVFTVGSGTITTTGGSGSTSNTDKVPEITTKHDNNDIGTYDPYTGADKSSTKKGTQYTITTCKGEAHQLFNSNSGIASLLSGTKKTMQRAFIGLQEMQKVIDTMMALIPYKNYTVQYNSVGKYNNYSCVAEGNKIRKIDKTSYLDPIIQEVDESTIDPTNPFTTVKINNWDRESSVYIKTKTALADPAHIDESKFSMNSLWSTLEHLNQIVYSNISSYYASVKRNVLNQYGQICNIEYIETTPCSFYLDKVYNICEAKVFGGDTFINRFALKRKMPFFLHTTCGMPNQTDIIYGDLFNVAEPAYYFNTPQPLAARLSQLRFSAGLLTAVEDVAGENIHYYDISKSGVFNQNGYVHLYNYGIPYFLVESDINVDYRHGEDHLAKDFYPHNRDLKQWFEELNVPIKEDNTFFYNRTYSKQNHESTICLSCVSTLKELHCEDYNPNKLIYSQPTEEEDKYDNWLTYKANDFHIFPLKLGRLISADGIENDKVLVRLEKGTQMFPAYNTIQATEQNIQVGTGGLFRNYPQDIAVTTLGYAGSEHRDIKHTEFGHLWASAERGQIFNLGSGGSSLDELSRYGNKNWFKENLPFQLRKDFQNIPSQDLDNNFKGIGLHYCFDKRFNRFLITKLDYKLLNKRVIYEPITKRFLIPDSVGDNPTIVDLNDSRYFCKKSWTMSYSFDTKSWTAYHSYTPNVYIQHISFFESSFIRLENQYLYAHNLSNKSYQVFYDKLYPFIIEILPKPSPTTNILNSIGFNLEVVRYHNEFDAFYSRTKTFNKAMVYNDHQATGNINLTVVNPEDLTQNSKYPFVDNTGYNVIVSNSEDLWEFNDIFDASINQLNNLPLMLNDCNNVNKTINPKAINYNKIDLNKQNIRHRKARVRFTNDVESNYSFIFNFAEIQQNQSYR